MPETRGFSQSRTSTDFSDFQNLGGYLGGYAEKENLLPSDSIACLAVSSIA